MCADDVAFILKESHCGVDLKNELSQTRRPLRVSQMGSIEHSRLNVVETEKDGKYMIIPYKTLKSKFKN